MHLTSCPACACAVFSTVGACPHCGEALSPPGLSRSVAALAMGLGLGLVGCSKGTALYGIEITDTFQDSAADADGDGFSVSDGDCDDENAEVHPGAEETAGDGVDSNCDGADDT